MGEFICGLRNAGRRKTDARDAAHRCGAGTHDTNRDLRTVGDEQATDALHDPSSPSEPFATKFPPIFLHIAGLQGSSLDARAKESEQCSDRGEE